MKRRPRRKRDHPELNFNGEKTGDQLRDQGIESVVSHTPIDYKEQFRRIGIQFVLEEKLPTSEDVTKACGMPPNHPHAVGGLTAGLIKDGYWVPVCDAKSQVRTSHSARLRRYRRGPNL